MQYADAAFLTIRVATGLLGREVVKAFEGAGYEAVGTGLTRCNPPSTVKLDLLDTDDVVRVLDEVKYDDLVGLSGILEQLSDW